MVYTWYLCKSLSPDFGRKFFFIEVNKTTNTQFIAFELETECLTAKHMSVPPNFKNSGHGVWAFLASSLEKRNYQKEADIQFSSPLSCV